MIGRRGPAAGSRHAVRKGGDEAAREVRGGQTAASRVLLMPSPTHACVRNHRDSMGMTSSMLFGRELLPGFREGSGRSMAPDAVSCE